MNDNTEQELRLKRLLAANKAYEGLAANPDFTQWKTDIVDAHISFLRDEVLSTNRSMPNWKESLCDRLVAYQESVNTYDTLFNMGIAAARFARDELKKSEGGER